jgi:hypothetical protein
MTFKDGGFYIGDWKDGYGTGKGTYYWKDGQKYVGEFLNNKRQGYGIETYPKNEPDGQISLVRETTLK